MLNQIDREQLIACIDGLPPLEYLEYLKTKDQIEHFKELWLEFYILGNSLKKHFSGEYDEVIDKLPKERYEFYKLWRDTYLALYDLIENNWKLILAKSKNEGIDFSTIPASTPGELLIRIVENDCRIMVNLCLYNHDFSPSQVYKAINYLRKPENDFTDNPKLNKIHNQIVKNKKYVGDLNDVKNFCIKVVSELSKSNFDKKYYYRYKKELGNLESYILKITHPSRKMRSYQWLEGKKYIL